MLFLVPVAAQCNDSDGKTTVRCANLFKIEYMSDSVKKITDGAGRPVMLIPRGNKKNTLEKRVTTIEIPVRHIALTCPMYAALIKPFGALDSIAGVNAEVERCYFKALEKGLKDGSIVSLGNGNTLDFERTARLRPDVVFADNWDAKKLAKLKELNIPVAVVNCYSESHPLGRMEWIKFMAAFYNKEADANRFFDAAFEKVEKIAARAGTAKQKPQVLSGGLYYGKASAPLPRSCTAKMIELGGGEYIIKDVNLPEAMGGYCNITLEAFFDKGKKANVYVFETAATEITSIEKLIAGAEILSTIKPVQNGNVWISQPGYWQALDKMDVIVHDLAFIFHPDLFPGHKLTYFRQLPRKD